MASRVQRDRKPSSKLQPEKDDGPLLEIRFTEEESNGKRMKLTQSFAVLKPKDIDTGKEKSIQELEELKKYAFFYTHHKAYYPAVLLEIKRQKRRSTTIEEDVDELQDENQGDNDSEDHEKTKPRTKKQKFEKADQTTEEPKSASSNQEPKKNNAKKKKTNDETEAKKNKEQRDRENNMKKAKAKTTSVLGQEILNKTDALKDLGVSDEILDQFVDADMLNYNISRMDESEDFEIEECSKTKHVEDPPLFQQQSENNENRPAQINLPLPAISKGK
ncbi:nucleolar protein 58-like [Clytia hemisphaerica]|uniref:nucleolar protein 58-like n=1 Tax=Clytia hemisphaerica TaxID=252671 RepID=UPI0034D73274